MSDVDRAVKAIGYTIKEAGDLYPWPFNPNLQLTCKLPVPKLDYKGICNLLAVPEVAAIFFEDNWVYDFIAERRTGQGWHRKESEIKSALDIQEGGSHYKTLAIQPVEYITKNSIPYLEGNVIKYVTRHSAKNGIEDIKKAIHYLQLIAELHYDTKL